MFELSERLRATREGCFLGFLQICWDQGCLDASSFSATLHWLFASAFPPEPPTVCYLLSYSKIRKQFLPSGKIASFSSKGQWRSQRIKQTFQFLCPPRWWRPWVRQKWQNSFLGVTWLQRPEILPRLPSVAHCSLPPRLQSERSLWNGRMKSYPCH